MIYDKNYIVVSSREFIEMLKAGKGEIDGSDTLIVRGGVHITEKDFPKVKNLRIGNAVFTDMLMLENILTGDDSLIQFSGCHVFGIFELACFAEGGLKAKSLYVSDFCAEYAKFYGCKFGLVCLRKVKIERDLELDGLTATERVNLDSVSYERLGCVSNTSDKQFSSPLVCTNNPEIATVCERLRIPVSLTEARNNRGQARLFAVSK